MYCINDIDYLKDFTMLLNDDIIDCFTVKKITAEQEKEVEVVYKEIKEIISNLDLNKDTIFFECKEYPTMKLSGSIANK